MIMAEGVFHIPASSVSSRYATGQPKFVVNVGLVPEAKAIGSCSLIKCNCMEGLTGGSTRCEASSRYSEEVLAYDYRDPSSSTVAAEDQLVLDLAKTSSNSTLFTLDPFKDSRWNGQKSAYMDIISCTNQNLPLPNPNAQRALNASVKSRLKETCHEFKPDDASSHNMLSKKSSGDLEMLSESITECLLQEDRADARQKEVDRMQTAVKGSKRKAAEIAKKPVGIEVQSERKCIEESRIVRVSRLTGGKDRHSKVRTAKGLRDRRVRLSVATAIQFYDLQDRLGLEQPSLAVDWLLKAAQPSIVELPVLDTDMHSVSVSAPAVDAGSNLASPSRSPVKYGESATAAVSVKNESNFSEKEMPIVRRKQSEVGKSSSSASDGSMMGAEYTSKASSLSKLARLKEARERARKKSASSKIPAASPQIDSLDSSVPSHLMNVLGYRDDSVCGISNQVSTGHIQQQLWDYSTPVSYTDILLKDSRQHQHMGLFGTSSTAALQQSMHSVVRSSYEMADSGMTFIDPRQRNGAQIHFNSMHPYPPQQQQSQAVQKQFATTFAPTLTNDASFSTCSRGPLQSNSSSCITNDPPPLRTHKNAYAEVSTKANMLPFHAYDARMPEQFSSILEGNANYEANH